jgi:deazaflavin-dependent oxidoreductase (nitroreductase family)
MSVATTASRARAHPLVLRVVWFFNRAVLFLAGTRFMPLWAVVTHRGRRSGKVFRTPVVVRAVDGGFVVPMPWGETTDWCRNIRAAGGCTVRWKSRDFHMSHPEIIDTATVSAAFSPRQAEGMRRFNIQQCLLLRHASAG